jgi:hypothetical protein
MKIKPHTEYEVLATKGRFYEGTLAGTICFVPNDLIQGGQLGEGPYVRQGWASLNIKAQQPRNGIGSHLFPDLTKPFEDAEGCARMKERMEQLRPQPVAAQGV